MKRARVSPWCVLLPLLDPWEGDHAKALQRFGALADRPSNTLAPESAAMRRWLLTREPSTGGE